MADRKKRKKQIPSGIRKVKSIKSLRALLQYHRIDFSSWGSGYTKNLSELMLEIRVGESVLVVKRGTLIRQTRHAQATITCVVDGVQLRLAEIRQEFSNGAVRIRKNTDRSTSEKLRADESPKAAMVRGIQEELGLQQYDGEGLVRDVRRPRKRRGDSAASYPNLSVEHVEFQFTWLMPDWLYVPSGYVEVQKRKKTYFEWKQIETASASL